MKQGANMTIREIKRPEVIFECPVCDEFHTTHADADECCRKKDTRTIYRCPECGLAAWLTERGAAKCCEKPGDETVIVG